MNHTDTGKDRIRKICEVIREETLTPAKEEAQKIIEKATSDAELILQKAKEQAEEIVKNSAREVEKQKKIFYSALEQTFKQALTSLRADIEEKLFNQELSQWIESSTADPKIIATLIEALVSAIEKEGSSADFSAYIPKSVSPEKVLSLLGERVVKKLREGRVEIGDFKGGAQLMLQDKKIRLDLSDAALKELVAQYTRKEFRKIIF